MAHEINTADTTKLRRQEPTDALHSTLLVLSIPPTTETWSRQQLGEVCGEIEKLVIRNWEE